MPKNRTHSELEHLRGEVKALQAENRRLKRQLRDQEKQHYSQDEEIETAAEDTDIDLCPNCYRGKLSLLDLGKFAYLTCPICDHREKIDER